MIGHDQQPRTVCVLCEAHDAAPPEYVEFSTALGEALAEHGVALVYGSSGPGPAAPVARASAERGGRVTGVVSLEPVNRGRPLADRLVEVYVTRNMHARNSLMYELSDAFVALPGGLGTMNDVFEVVSWAKLELHHKPIVVANVAGYFDPVLTWLDRAIDGGFLSSADRGLIAVVDTVEDVLARLGLLRPAVTPALAPPAPAPDRRPVAARRETPADTR